MSFGVFIVMWWRESEKNVRISGKLNKALGVPWFGDKEDAGGKSTYHYGT
jgi:hypothetical protein